MGYRANVITQHRKYGSQTFGDYNEFVEFQEALREKGVEIQGDENEEFFEVDKEDLQKYVDELADDGEVSDYPSYTNSDLKQELQNAIDESKGNWISWEWF